MKNSNLDSTFPPDTFEGSNNLGTLDVPEARNRNDPNTKRFICLRQKVLLRRGAPFSAWFYRFSVVKSPSRLVFEMQEEPDTTIYLELYDQDRKLIDTFRGNASETIDRVFEKGLYFIKINIGNASPNPDGFFVARVTARGMPEKINLSSSFPAPPKQLGSLSNGGRVTDNGFLWSVDEGSLPAFNDRLPIFTHCVPRREPKMRPYNIYEVFARAAGTINFRVEPTILRNWPSNNLGIYASDGTGGFRPIVGNSHRVPQGTFRFAVGHYDRILYVEPDAYAEYTLTLSA